MLLKLRYIQDMVKTRRAPSASTPQQLLPMHRHGGARPGAGRPRKPGSGVPHLRRAPLAARHPVHVTTRVRKLPSLRRRDCFRVVRRAVLAGAERPGFRVVEFSVQSNHLHLICEGSSRQVLARGLQGLFTRIALRLNAHLGRSGQVVADRYHDHVLRTPAEVRRALFYVLDNARRHQGRRPSDPWVDPCSSAPAFRGLTDGSGLPPPHTWLLREGWRRSAEGRFATAYR